MVARAQPGVAHLAKADGRHVGQGSAGLGVMPPPGVQQLRQLALQRRRPTAAIFMKAIACPGAANQVLLALRQQRHLVLRRNRAQVEHRWCVNSASTLSPGRWRAGLNDTSTGCGKGQRLQAD